MYSGTTEKGFNRASKNQIKKHISQITDLEKELLTKRLKNIDLDSLELSEHLLSKLHTNFNEDIIKNILKDNDIIKKIIEFNINKDKKGNVYDCRILIRDNNIYKVNLLNYITGKEETHPANICFVYSLTFNRIITVYWNKSNDNHSTINMSQYKNIDIKKYLA